MIDKNKIRKLHKKGLKQREIAKIMGCSPSTVYKNLDSKRENKSKNSNKNSVKKHPLIVKRNSFLNRGNKERPFSVSELREKIGNNPICYLTGRKIDLMDKSSYQLDHIIPINKGGDNSLNNCGLLLKEINQAKSDLKVDDFIKMCISVVVNNGYVVI